MDWKSHLVFGIFAGGAVAFLIGGGVLQLALVAGIAALVPDIDVKGSKIARLAAAAGIAILLAAAWVWDDEGALEFALVAAVALAAVWLLSLARPAHRTITHTFWFALAASGICFFAGGWQIWLAVLAGVFSHIAADGLPGKKGQRH